MNTKTIATSELGLRTIKQTALELDIKIYEVFDLIISGDKRALAVARNAYKKFK